MTTSHHKLSSNPGVLATIAVFVVIFFHIIKLDTLPLGLYLDETSIGINAASIAKSGQDEYGSGFPIYFKAFGEYKNPVYIYTTAALFKVFGVSAENLRFTSAFFYLLGLIPCLLLVRNIFPNAHQTHIFAIITLGFLPQLFTLSRISFEVISQFTFTAWSLFFTWRLLNMERNLYKHSILLGATIGLSVYSYSTARLLSALYCASLAWVLLNRQHFKALTVIAIVCLITLTPYFLFSLDNQGALTARFKDVSYIDDPISTGQKIAFFIRNYYEYFSLNYLVFKGDGNLRHAIGYGGEIFLCTYIFALLAVATSTLRPQKIKDKFKTVLLLNLAFSPFAAALTNEGTPHSLRGMLVGVYLSIFSIYGFHLATQKLRVLDITRCSLGIILLLSYEASAYIFSYFVVYPERSIHATESYSVEGRLQEAIFRQPKKIYFVKDPAAAYANFEFARYSLENPLDIPIEAIGDREINPQNGECVVYHRWNNMESRLGNPIYENDTKFTANWLQRLIGIQDKPHVMKLRCY